MPALAPNELRDTAEGESSASVRARVDRARDRQRVRFADREGAVNARMSAREVRRWCGLDETSQRLLDAAAERFALSARAYSRVLKIARTIADLAGEEAIRAGHVAEAIQYRALAVAMESP